MSKVVMVVNDTNFVWNLRREVLQKLISQGYQVTLVTEVLGFREELEAMGCKLIEVKTKRRGTNPLADAQLLLAYWRALKAEKPDVVLTNNIKPNVYGGMACRLLHIPYMPNVCGLGTPVENPGLMQKITTRLYKIGVKGCTAIFFQNEENRQFFYDRKIMPKKAKVVVTPGSGVNLETHPVLSWPEGPVHLLFAARIMKQKGIDLFLAAARKYASEDVIFDVCGQCDDGHYLEILQNEQCIRYHGLQSDMMPFYARCSCFLYPSYYPEGMSNVLLEAAACGRPVVAADRAGCRETVENGISGYVVPVNDEASVLEAVEKFLSLTAEERRAMGLAGRRKAETEFDRRIVAQIFSDQVRSVLNESQVLV